MRKSLKVVPVGKKKCIWMEAGVASYKLCDNNYDCSTCSYDHGMEAKINKNKIAASDKFNQTWMERMMLMPASQRKCRYMLTGEIGRKLCPSAYQCGTCSFDHKMQERLQAQVLPIHQSQEIAGFALAENFYYHEGHAWARLEYGGRIRVGLDDFAIKVLGDQIRVKLPEIGEEVKQGVAGFNLTRHDQTVAVLAPMDGVVTHINNDLVSNPELLKQSPYEKGWLCTLEPTSLRKNLKNMYFDQEAHDFVRSEREKLFNMVNDDIHIAADGGEIIENIFEAIEEDWAKFAQKFLRS